MIKNNIKPYQFVGRAFLLAYKVLKFGRRKE